MTTPSVTAPGAGPNHGRRVIVAWLILSVIATPLVTFVLGPALPPGKSTDQAAQQVWDNTVLTMTITPVICLLVVYFAYALTTFRQRGTRLEDAQPVRGDATVQMAWVAITSALVLFLAGFGTWELLDGGSGGGQGPGPVAIPSGHKMPVQVIGQQWTFTYRYPTEGGLETPHLVLPENTLVEFHVTSLDVVHSFWAYELGVKADANPGIDNVAYVQLKGARSFHIHCAELCGLWHGYMFDTGKVVSQSEFASWVQQQKSNFAPGAKYLPPYSKTYFPDPQLRAG